MEKLSAMSLLELMEHLFRQLRVVEGRAAARLERGHGHPLPASLADLRGGVDYGRELGFREEPVEHPGAGRLRVGHAARHAGAQNPESGGWHPQGLGDGLGRLDRERGSPHDGRV